MRWFVFALVLLAPTVPAAAQCPGGICPPAGSAYGYSGGYSFSSPVASGSAVPFGAIGGYSLAPSAQGYSSFAAPSTSGSGSCYSSSYGGGQAIYSTPAPQAPPAFSGYPEAANEMGFFRGGQSYGQSYVVSRSYSPPVVLQSAPLVVERVPFAVPEALDDGRDESSGDAQRYTRRTIRAPFIRLERVDSHRDRYARRERPYYRMARP